MKNALRILATGTAVASLAAISTPALAAGVSAGTLIENTATATYSTGGGSQSVDSNTVELRVDELLDVTVAWADAAPVPQSGSAVLAFNVTNTGNGPEAFTLTADPAIAGNDFDAEVVGLAIDTNDNGVYDEGVDQLIANGANSPILAADESVVVFVLVDSPAGATDGEDGEVRLRAEAVTGTGSPGDAFAGAGEGGGDAVVGTSGGDDDDLGALSISAATVTLVKSATILDPFGGSQAVPGATVTFSIVATATGSGSVSDLVVNDAIPAGTTYDPGTLALEGSGLTDAADADAGEFAAGAVSVDIGTLPGGTTRTVTFDVIIDEDN
jgi:uncharacterized repeat protein (TIGR01451 family)